MSCCDIILDIVESPIEVVLETTAVVCVGLLAVGPPGPNIPATQVGQVLYSRDGAEFTAELPMLTSEGIWVSTSEGILLVV